MKLEKKFFFLSFLRYLTRDLDKKLGKVEIITKYVSREILLHLLLILNPN
ncbi:protein of unknown function [Candidatus Nitrosocosmicus franklandus]|uniref:Uncharacterized protein n=1 Tax=Candidatus Nitrosocosmicus franklandianus TaxID=1798806 RepID=A0A484I826_9ARCH|nr:protein of unknown function [Candidatus Nitrosocosmicus franklandus]